MYEYRSEVLKTSLNWTSDKAKDEDIAALDALINQRSAEGWELVLYDYMVTSLSVRGAFLITFKRPKQ